MLLLFILFLPLVSSMINFYYHSSGRGESNRLSQLLMLAVFVISLFSPFLIDPYFDLQFKIPITVSTKFSIDLYYDSLTWIMLCLVSFVSLIIHSYSSRYLLSDQNQARFMAQLSFLTFSVSLLMMSGNLLTAFVAWQFIGLSLYLLLNHYHYDVKANKAAKKKFMINRVGDIAFLVAVILALLKYDSTDFTLLFQQNSQTNYAILILIFIAIMTKCAQFPFHIWLIDTMEAPTPVSALMHAGVINAGGFLLARLSPLYAQNEYLMLYIFSVGLITALLGSFFMQYQADIKRQLAYSTMSQMGYMVMQCGLGLFSSAVFHLIAHGFLKATLFLSSGSTLAQRNLNNTAQAFETKNSGIISLIITLILISLGVAYFYSKHSEAHLNPLIWFFVGITLYQILRTLLSKKANFLAILVLFLVYFAYLLILQQLDIILGHGIIDQKISLWSQKVSITISILLVLGVALYYGLNRNPRQDFLRLLYPYGFSKGSIEKIFRKGLINPMRRSGDLLIQLFNKIPKFLAFVLLGVFLSGFIFVFFNYLNLVHENNHFTKTFSMTVALLLFVVILLVSNRVGTLPKTLGTLMLSMFTLVGMCFWFGHTQIGLIGLLQLLNSILLFFGFFLLLRKSKPKALTLAIENRLPWSHFYMAFFLIFFIGLPGTPTFLTEFYLLRSLVEINLYYVILLGFGLLLLSLVILHTLQTHFFNPKAAAQYAIKLPLTVHVFCLLIIGFNFFNGLYPKPALGLLSSLLGVQ